MQRYTLTITEKHAEIIADALDLYVRIGLGQFEKIVRVYDRKYALSPEVKQRMVEQIQAAKVLAGHTPHGSYGLLSPEVSDRFRVAYDILQVVRDRNVSSPAVDVDEGIRVADGEPMPTITSSKQECSQ
jgi:hypothetical protein